MSKYKGPLEGVPEEIVSNMLYYQVQQGNKEDVSVFESSLIADKSQKGFDWDKTIEGKDWWNRVLIKKEYDLFFERYHETQAHNKQKSWIKEWSELRKRLYIFPAVKPVKI